MNESNSLNPYMMQGSHGIQTFTFLVKCGEQTWLNINNSLFKIGKCKGQVQRSRCPFECGAGRQLLQQTGWSGRGQAPQKTPHATFPSQWTQTSTLTPVWTSSMHGCFHRVPAFTFSWRPPSNLFTAHKWKALKELPLFIPNTHFIEKINTNRAGQHSQDYALSLAAWKCVATACE